MALFSIMVFWDMSNWSGMYYFRDHMTPLDICPIDTGITMARVYNTVEISILYISLSYLNNPFSFDSLFEFPLRKFLPFSHVALESNNHKVKPISSSFLISPLPFPASSASMALEIFSLNRLEIKLLLFQLA